VADGEHETTLSFFVTNYTEKNLTWQCLFKTVLPIPKVSLVMQHG